MILSFSLLVAHRIPRYVNNYTVTILAPRGWSHTSFRYCNLRSRIRRSHMVVKTRFLPGITENDIVFFTPDRPPYSEVCQQLHCDNPGTTWLISHQFTLLQSEKSDQAFKHGSENSVFTRYNRKWYCLYHSLSPTVFRGMLTITLWQSWHHVVDRTPVSAIAIWEVGSGVQAW